MCNRHYTDQLTVLAQNDTLRSIMTCEQGKVIMKNKTMKRKTYWEIDDIFNCPVVGTCLTLREQKKVLKKSGISITNLRDHQIHEMLVSSGKSEGPISRRIQRALENKYREQIAKLGACDEKTFWKLWQKGLRRGEIDSLFWIGVTNTNLPPATVTQMFNDYHMHTHGQGEIIRDQLQQVDYLRAKNKQLTTKLKEMNKKNKDITQTLQTSQRERARLQKQVQALQTKNKTLQNRPCEARLLQANNDMKRKIKQLESRLQAQDDSLALFKAENSRLSGIVEEQAKINQLLQTEFAQLAPAINEDQSDSDESLCAVCPHDLCSRRVLMVGGLDNLRPHYQNLVESGGGEFKHYNSRYGTNERALRAMIGWADLILCPIDFNSHRNCLSVKKLCKKMYKPYYMLPNSSTSSIYRVLTEVSTEAVMA